MNNGQINELIDRCILNINNFSNKYNYPSNITHLLYLIVPAFIIKYGFTNENVILKNFNEIPILIDDKEDNVYQAYYTSIPYLSNSDYVTHKGIVLKNYKNTSLMQLLDNLVHEFNHAINSINQEIKIDDDKLFIRTGLTLIVYDKNKLVPINKDDNSILEEIINTKQTEMIIDIINSFNNYEITNVEVVNTLYSIQNSIDKNYKSNAYLLQSYVCMELINNKTFMSTLENLRFKGNIEDIELWFDSITGEDNSYKVLTKLLKESLDLQMELTNKKGFRYFKVNKIKYLNNQAMRIVKLFDNNCNYR